MKDRNAHILEVIEGDWITLSPLGGMSNRSFRITTDRGDYVLRLPGAGTPVDRDHERVNLERAVAAGVAPEPLWLGDDGTLITRFIEGSGIQREALRQDPTSLTRVAELLRRVHDIGDFADRFDPQVEMHRYRSMLTEVPEVTDDLIAAVDRLDLDGPLVSCHNDPVPANLVVVDHQYQLIDWEYAGMNDPAWDLAQLTIECGLDAKAQGPLYAGYGEDLTERVAVYEFMSEVVWGLWGLWDPLESTCRHASLSIL